jgi:RNA polymerase subunit RPABC4/transcription elongation factor Spt4
MPDESMNGRTCSWCSAAAPDSATQCPSCGAALAQRESIGGLVIPGVTTVDLALHAIDGQPIHLRGPSPTQGMASGVMAAAVLPGPLAIAAIGGLAAVGAAEYLGAARHSSERPAIGDIGQPSEVTLRALERLEGAETGQVAAPATDPWLDLPVRPADGPAVDDPWRDLPIAPEADPG